MASGKRKGIDMKFNSSLLFPKAFVKHEPGRSSDSSLFGFPSHTPKRTVVYVTETIDPP